MCAIHHVITSRPSDTDTSFAQVRRQKTPVDELQHTWVLSCMLSYRVLTLISVRPFSFGWREISDQRDPNWWHDLRWRWVTTFVSSKHVWPLTHLCLSNHDYSFKHHPPWRVARAELCPPPPSMHQSGINECKCVCVWVHQLVSRFWFYPYNNCVIETTKSHTYESVWLMMRVWLCWPWYQDLNIDSNVGDTES